MNICSAGASCIASTSCFSASSASSSSRRCGVVGLGLQHRDDLAASLHVERVNSPAGRSPALMELVLARQQLRAGTPGPASITMNATSFDCVRQRQRDQRAFAVPDQADAPLCRRPCATSGTRRRPARRRRKLVGRRRRGLPVEPPTPRSSTRSTAMPRRVRSSASTRNGLWPMSSSLRSCGPEPVISSTAGNGPPKFGFVNEPANVTSRGGILVAHLFFVVRIGLRGLLRPLGRGGQPGSSVSGNERPACDHVPTNLRGAALQLAFEYARDARDFTAQPCILERDTFERDPVGALIGAVDACRQRAPGVARQVEAQRSALMPTSSAPTHEPSGRALAIARAGYAEADQQRGAQKRIRELSRPAERGERDAFARRNPSPRRRGRLPRWRSCITR